MPVPLSDEPTATDSSRVVRVFNSSKIGQSKLPLSLRRSLQSKKCMRNSKDLHDEREYGVLLEVSITSSPLRGLIAYSSMKQTRR